MTASILDRVVTGDQLDAMTFPPLKWTVPGVIPEGFGLLVGPPKLGKSWLALGIALAVALGGIAFGHIPIGQARPVLYLALEDGERRLQARCRHLLDADASIPANLHLVLRATPAEVVPLIEAWLERHPDGVVLLDTLGKVMPLAAPGESAYQRDYRVGGKLKELTDTHPGSTLIVVHHNRKAVSEDWMDSTSGTQGLNGSADFTVALSRTRNEADALLKVTGRDVAEAEYAMTAAAGTWTLKGDSLEAAAKAAREATVTAGVGDRMAEVIGWVSAQAAAVTPAMVGRALNLDSDDAGRYLRRAVEGGRLRRASRGYYLPLSEVSEVSESGNVTYLPGTEPDTDSDTPADSVRNSTERLRRSQPDSDTTDSSDTPTEAGEDQ